MDNFEPITLMPPPDERRFLYTAFGRRLYGMNNPIFVHDSLRSRPTLVVGSTGYGKTDFLLSMAMQDAAKGRLVVFVDGKCEASTMQKLYYYVRRLDRNRATPRPFLTFLPFQDLDHLTSTWNPLLSTTLPIGTIAEAFFNAYDHPDNSEGANGAYYTEYQRNIFVKLMRALHTSGYAYSPQDIQHLVSSDYTLDNLHRILNAAGTNYYVDVLKAKREDKRKFNENMLRFANHLKMFDHWSLNSYNPTIQFDRLLHTDAVIYVGLPVNSQTHLMSAVGNILINQLKALSAHVQSNNKMKRHAISCIIDEAGSFIDNGMAEWIAKVRSSGFMLTLGIQVLANLLGRRPGFDEEIKANSPNVLLFNPQNEGTAQWFSSLSGQEQHKSVSANVEGAGGEFSETGAGTVRTAPDSRVPLDAMLALRTGQFFYRPAVTVERPYLLAAPYLPDPPERPDLDFQRSFHLPPAELRGLNLHYQVSNERARVAETMQGTRG